MHLPEPKSTFVTKCYKNQPTKTGPVSHVKTSGDKAFPLLYISTGATSGERHKGHKRS